MPKNITGKPVKGTDFFDREDILARIWDRLKDGNNVLLLAPRRVGKSSLIFRLQDDAKSHGFQPLVVSVASAKTEAEFFDKLITAFDSLNNSGVTQMLKRFARRGNWLRRTKKFTLLRVAWEFFELADDWKEAGEDLRLGLAQLPDRWLMMIDELPIFIHRLLANGESTDRAAVFLDWLRELRIAENSPKNVQWLFSGSIGLDTVTRQVQLGDKINDLHNETGLGAFDPMVAREFLTSLGRDYELHLRDEVISYVIERTGWLLPFHLQLFFSEIRDIARHSGETTHQTIDAAYEQLMSPRKRGAFDFWIQRLSKELPRPIDSHSLLLLDAVARNPRGASRQVLDRTLAERVSDPDERKKQLDFVLHVLLTEGYLVTLENRHHFQSIMLADFWRRSRLK